MATKATVTELEVLFTANTQQVDKAAQDVRNTAQKIERNPAKQKVDGDAKDALDAMDRVEKEAKRIVSAKTIATVDANIERAETSLVKVQERLDYLRSVESTMEVTADIKKAEAALQQITRRRDALTAARESMVVDADTAPAEAALDEVANKADEAGDKGGRAAGEGLGDGIVDALKAIPIAGGVVLAGIAIGKAVVDGIQEGLQVEVSQDRLQALTGIDEASARRLAMAAGEAYANAFGGSIEENMDAARLGVQFDLIDPDATARQSQRVIQSLSGISDVLGEDVRPIATAVTTLLKTGLARSADEAFDLLAVGAREGVNRGEDLLDTLTEYPAVFARLGIDGAESLGLINQALGAGARNSDVAADALKEFQIRATDASESSAQGFQRLGLDAEAMTAKIAAGGEGAREGLDLVLDALRATEDPVQRNAAAVELFGTKAEDLGDALFAMDLSTAVDELNGVTGAAERMFDTLADNDSTKIEAAKRNIEVAAEGIKGALAAAFSPQIEGFATFVTENRAAVLTFLFDAANAGIDFARTLVEGAASGTEAFGSMVNTVGPQVLGLVEGLLEGLDSIPFVDLSQAREEFALTKEAALESFGAFEEQTAVAADEIRLNLIENGLDPAQAKLNEVGIPLVAQARFHDATVALANDLGAVGFAADGSELSISLLNGTVDRSTASGELLHQQIRAVVDGMHAQAEAGVAAGESADVLTESANATRDALINQLTQMGLTKDEAVRLANAYGAVPEIVNTAFEAQTSGAQADVDAFLARNQNRRIVVRVDSVGGTTFSSGKGNQIGMRDGGILAMAGGGSLTPMAPLAQAVPPNTWRVVGDRMKDREFYIPDDGSARSLTVLLEAMRSFGLLPMADGGALTPGSTSTRSAPTSRGGDAYTFNVDASSLRSVADLEQLLQNARRLSRQKNGVR